MKKTGYITRLELLLSIFVGFIFNPVSIWGQTPTFNARWDTLKLLSAKAYMAGDLVQATAYTDSLILMSHQPQNDSLEVVALERKSSIMPENEETLSVLEQTIQKARIFGNIKLISSALNNLALFHLGRGDIKAAYPITKEILAIADSTHNERIYMNGLIQLAQIYLFTGDNTKSQKAQFEIIQLSESFIKQDQQLNPNKKSMYYYQRLVEANLGVVFGFTNPLKADSIKIFCEAALAPTSGAPQLRGRAFLGFAYLYYLTKEPFSLKRALDSASQYIPQENRLQLSTYNYFLSNYYLLTHQPQKSISVLRPWVEESIQAGYTNETANYYKVFYTAFEETGQMDSAYHYFKLHSALKDTIADQQLKLKIDLYEVDREIRAKEVENLKLQQQKNLWQQRTLWISISSAILLILVASALAFARRAKWQANRISILNTTLHETNERLDRFSSTVSHDILSHLNFILVKGTIVSSIHKNKHEQLLLYTEEVQEYGRKLKEYCIALLREARQSSSLAQKGGMYSPLPGIEAAIGLYQPKIMSKNLTIVTGDLSPSSLPTVVVEHLFQNILSNTLKYATQIEEPFLHIREEEQEDGKRCWIAEDNGRGIAPDVLSDLFTENPKSGAAGGQGVGLYQVKKQLKLYGADINTGVSQYGGACFVISLPHPFKDS